MLLDAAASVLVERGVAGCTTAAVTDRAGLSNGALFRHFPTRLDLLTATVAHVLDGLREGYEGRYEAVRSADARDRSPEVLLALLDDAMRDPAFAAVLELYGQARTDAELRDALRPVVARHGEQVHDLVVRIAAVLAGEDRRAAERVTAVAHLAVVALQGFAIGDVVGASRGRREELLDLLSDLVTDALGGPR